MADFYGPTDLTTNAAPDSEMLAMPSGAESSTSDLDAELGYESAHPWALGEMASQHGDLRC